MTAQLDLFAIAEPLPAEVFDVDIQDFEELHASEERDMQYPVETVIRDSSSAGNWMVHLRGIECGVWLWGVDVYCKKQMHGCGFYPFRKWGPGHAAMDREAAAQAALAYVVDFLKG